MIPLPNVSNLFLPIITNEYHHLAFSSFLCHINILQCNENSNGTKSVPSGNYTLVEDFMKD